MSNESNETQEDELEYEEEEFEEEEFEEDKEEGDNEEDESLPAPKTKKERRYSAKRDVPGYVVLQVPCRIDKPTAEAFSEAGFKTEKAVVGAMRDYYGDPADVPKEDRPKGWVPFNVTRLVTTVTRQLEIISEDRKLAELIKLNDNIQAEIDDLKKKMKSRK